jgi:hypothetical protein
MTIEATATHPELLERSLSIMRNYEGDCSVTLKLNCFAGILMIIRELIHKPDDDPVWSQSIHDPPWSIPIGQTSGKMVKATVWDSIVHVRDAMGHPESYSPGHPRVSPWNDDHELRGFDFYRGKKSRLRLSEHDMLQMSEKIVESLLPKIREICREDRRLAEAVEQQIERCGEIARARKRQGDTSHGGGRTGNRKGQ